MLELLAVQVAIRSLLPLISTVIEKVIHDQAQAFLDGNKILYRFQSGFRKHFSTDSCLSYLNNKIATGFESGLHTGMILLIFRRHPTQLITKSLSIKWNSLGFSKKVILWFKSYHIENLRLI